MSALGPPCTICQHNHRPEIDRKLLALLPMRDIAGQFAVSRSALSRHRRGCIPDALAAAAASSEAVTASRLVCDLEELGRVTRAILGESRSTRNHAVSLAAIARLEKQAELIARLAGELIERREVSQISITVDAHWVELRGRLLAALRPHPEALASVLAELGDVERLA